MHDISSIIHVITAIDKDHLQLYIHWGRFAGELKNNILDGHLKLTVIYTSKQGFPNVGHTPPWGLWWQLTLFPMSFSQPVHHRRFSPREVKGLFSLRSSSTCSDNSCMNRICKNRQNALSSLDIDSQ